MTLLRPAGHDGWVRNWVAWHEAYDDPASRLSARLKLVKQHLAAALDRAPAGPIRLVSLCAGQGRLCGIFGNVSRADIERLVFAAAGLCRPGGTVIWTRNRRPPDLTPRVRGWLAAAGFEEVAFGSPESAPRTGVGAAVRRDGVKAALPDGSLFRFGSAGEDRAGGWAAP